jgi:AcrR family transcriptional regulator
MSQPDTRQRLLDAAEHLFSREGFHNTSLRTITAGAGVNVAAVNYHFGSKEALLEAVLDRRLVPLNNLRRNQLEGVRDEARSQGRRPETREVLRAFIEPAFRFRASGAGADAFMALAGRAIAEPDDTLRNLFGLHMEPVFSLLLEVLGAALPSLSRETLLLRLHFVLGAMGHTLCAAGRFQVFPTGPDFPANAEYLTVQLLDFVTAGLEAT